ncbi:MAG: tRNA (adenosine(37)-N6)-threonylcarbamoyltransferase complex dimerization subunit type 1 TsaB [Bacteroidetes bacterium]|nr:tRNA (adenosine(37)-N6)-threonylcarbamoyltransferase complex dimerization subunit type 1 TsaB [Bacteroidota bacterium]
MSLLLLVDTATDIARVALLTKDQVLAFRENSDSRQHATFVQPAIEALCVETSIQLAQLEGVVVVNGPGSYTGLRVGLSSAKGICFALQIPLYTLNTLQIMAAASIRNWKSLGNEITPETLFCPMIDARRMEVFTALYNANLQPTIPPQALILNDPEGKIFTERKNIIYSGNGSAKLISLLPEGTFCFPECIYLLEDLSFLAYKTFITGYSTDIAYSEPIYIKDFHNTSLVKQHGANI